MFCNDERSYVVLNGLEESFTEGVQLFEHILNNVRGNEKVLKNMIADIISKRDNEKKDKRVILRNAMMNYAKFGAHSPFTDILSKETLLSIQAETLVDKIKNLSSLPHRIFTMAIKR